MITYPTNKQLLDKARHYFGIGSMWYVPEGSEGNIKGPYVAIVKDIQLHSMFGPTVIDTNDNSWSASHLAEFKRLVFDSSDEVGVEDEVHIFLSEDFNVDRSEPLTLGAEYKGED